MRQWRFGLANGVYGNLTQLSRLSRSGCKSYIHAYAGMLIFAANFCLKVALILVEAVMTDLSG
jgi:hypothetical protein